MNYEINVLSEYLAENGGGVEVLSHRIVKHQCHIYFPSLVIPNFWN